MEDKRIYAIYAGSLTEIVRLLNDYTLEFLAFTTEKNGDRFMLVQTVPSNIRYIKEHGPRPTITVIGD